MLKLTAEDLEYYISLYGLNAYAIAKVTGVDHSSIARRIRNMGLRKQKQEKKHIVIPDCQIKDEVDISYLTAIGKFIVEEKPSTIICLGDFADMPSLCSYDRGKRSFEGRRYWKDISSAEEAMYLLMKPIQQEINRDNTWKPELELTLGNHENRINRAIDLDPILEGTISIKDLDYESYGWKVHPFLEVIKVDDICYSHYFTSGVMGRVVPSAKVLIGKKHQSCIMGHVQHWDISMDHKADGTPIIGLFAGTCNIHNEDYLGPQGNNYWRGIWKLDNIKDGSFHPNSYSLEYLMNKYA